MPVEILSSQMTLDCIKLVYLRKVSLLMLKRRVSLKEDMQLPKCELMARAVLAMVLIEGTKNRERGCLCPG